MTLHKSLTSCNDVSIRLLVDAAKQPATRKHSSASRGISFSVAPLYLYRFNRCLVRAVCVTTTVSNNAILLGRTIASRGVRVTICRTVRSLKLTSLWSRCICVQAGNRGEAGIAPEAPLGATRVNCSSILSCTLGFQLWKIKLKEAFCGLRCSHTVLVVVVEGRVSKAYLVFIRIWRRCHQKCSTLKKENVVQYKSFYCCPYDFSDELFESRAVSICFVFNNQQ